LPSTGGNIEPFRRLDAGDGRRFKLDDSLEAYKIFGNAAKARALKVVIAA
jgi:hypothetical protein